MDFRPTRQHMHLNQLSRTIAARSVVTLALLLDVAVAILCGKCTKNLPMPV